VTTTSQEIDMLRKNGVLRALGLAAAGAWFAAMVAQAQTPATDSAKQATTGQATPAPAGATASGAGAAASLSSADKKMLIDLAQANMAEVEAGRLAQTKSQNEQVKTFSQKMIDDHNKALDDIRQLAQTKGVTLPTEPDRMHKAMAARLQRLSGDAFDRAYLSQAGVYDHKKAHALLQRVQSRAKDPELKALAARTLPVVDEHLSTVEQLHSTAHGSSKTEGTTGSSDKK
jgi:putative membrane protein